MAAAPSFSKNLPLVAIGVSADDLSGVTLLLEGLSQPTGMAFLMTLDAGAKARAKARKILAGDTAIPVVDFIDGLKIAADHLYLCPPGTVLTQTQAGLAMATSSEHPALLPFELLVDSMSRVATHHPLAVVILTHGWQASAPIESTGALVIVADGVEGAASDAVLPIPLIGAALKAFAQLPGRDDTDVFEAVIDLACARSPHDFRLYKPGTLRRRIEQRMLLSKISLDEPASYLALLNENGAECDRLVKDLLINVTSFFRDPGVFEHLAARIIPDLVRGHDLSTPLRVWCAGCSTGEEAYSLAILFLEAIAADGRLIRLQMFASDVSGDAIASARNGNYPKSIQHVVSGPRLERFFNHDEHGYQVGPELRSVIVFTLQDVLADPPFPHIDFISCRNLLIYLVPAAQAKVIGHCWFALRKQGLLLLGGAETISDPASGFEVVAKPERLYRKIGHGSHHARFGLEAAGLTARLARMAPSTPRPRAASLAELARRHVLETHAPAAVLIDRTGKYLYSLGPTSRYLQVSAGYPTTDLLDMAAPVLRAKLATAIEQLAESKSHIIIRDNRVGQARFDVDIRTVGGEGENLLLVAFIEHIGAPQDPLRHQKVGPTDTAKLEHELATTQEELRIALHALEASRQQQKEVSEDALAVTEEYESTNEELLTSKEELQALNEELTVLNAQLHETLERQRSTSDDLQNVLYSTDVPTLCLDTDLRIRFFTPTVQTMFTIIDSDVGRSITDLRPQSSDPQLNTDCAAVLAGALPRSCELEVQEGRWFQRRVLPYYTHEKQIDGVVITYADITERKQAKRILLIGKQQAEAANLAKSRFLAAASHDLRQPLQSLILLQALLAKTVREEAASNLIERFGQTLDAMTGMLNVLLDINQIEAGVVQTEEIDFPIESIFARLRDEFTPLAEAQRLDLRVAHSGLRVRSDPRLLEQMIRNLLANAIKYTRSGGVVIGCRRDQDRVRLEVWDTGIGIAEADLRTIFDEFHQVDNSARATSKGLGLGLSIVQRLGVLLGHDVGVRSLLGKGSVFSVRIPVATADVPARPAPGGERVAAYGPRPCMIMVIEDEPEVRELLELLLTDAGHTVRTAETADAAIALIANEAIRPDIVLADYNLPGRLDGVEALKEIRHSLNHRIPGIILTGAISSEAQKAIAGHDCLHLTKPIKLAELMTAIEHLTEGDTDPADTYRPGQAVIYVIDGQTQVRSSIRDALGKEGLAIDSYPDAETFLAAYRPGTEGCLLTNATLPGMSGMDLLTRLREMRDPLPTIMMTASSDVNLAVAAMKAGACDFIEKPVSRAKLLTSIRRALDQSRNQGIMLAEQEVAARHVADLTPRQLQVMQRVLAGRPSKVIAAELGISQRTIENHRAAIMRIMDAKSLPELARAALAADKRPR